MTDPTDPAEADAHADEPGPSAASELVEEVDEEGNVLRIVTRAQLRAGALRHRCTYTMLRTTSDELVVHRRADWKDIYPGYWDLAFGGVCGVGESWLDAAIRELAEESGVVGVPVRDLGPVRYDAPDGHVVGRAFEAVSDDEPTCPDGEVVEIDRVPIAELAAWMEGRAICLDSRQLLPPLLGVHR